MKTGGGGRGRLGLKVPYPDPSPYITQLHPFFHLKDMIYQREKDISYITP